MDTSIDGEAKRVKVGNDQQVDDKMVKESSEDLDVADSENHDPPEAQVEPVHQPPHTYNEIIPPGQRERLQHEPPIFDYSDFDHYDAVQKKFKEEGGRVFPWRTRSLDLHIEISLLHMYQCGVRDSHPGHENSTLNQKSFSEGLWAELYHDKMAVIYEEHAYRHDAGAGKLMGKLSEM